MVGLNDIVITGLGCISPIGIGREAMLQGLLERKCAVRELFRLSDPQQTTFFGASIEGFDGKQYVTPRKALKVMSHEVQLAYSAAHLAWRDACLTESTLDPDRVGVVFGAEIIPGETGELLPATGVCLNDGEMDHSKWGPNFNRQIFPLWMLKYLPNMAACHVGIAVDARGPNNTISQDEVSGLLALSEAAAIVERGQADLVIVGNVSSRVTPTRLMYRNQRLYDQHPHDASTDGQPRCIPFDARRRGIVPSEGAAVLIIESRRHAMQRGAEILAVVAGTANRCGKPLQPYEGSRQAIASAATAALEAADLSASELAHISAQGFSEKSLDIEEAAAIAEVASNVPVTAFSSYFGTAGSGCSLLELTASILAVRNHKTLPTLGYAVADEACPIQVPTSEQPARGSHFLKLSFTPQGQAAAVVVQCMT